MISQLMCFLLCRARDETESGGEKRHNSTPNSLIIFCQSSYSYDSGKIVIEIGTACTDRSLRLIRDDSRALSFLFPDINRKYENVRTEVGSLFSVLQPVYFCHHSIRNKLRRRVVVGCLHRQMVKTSI